MTNRDPRSGWTRLEETLIAIKPGETVTVEALAADSGLRREAIEELLDAVIKSDLFERREDGCYARRGRIESTALGADGRATIVDGLTHQSAEPPAAPLARQEEKRDR